MEPNQGFSYREVVGGRAVGCSVLDWLTAGHRHSDRETWRRRIEVGEVELQGRIAAPDEALAAGQLLVWHRPPWIEPAVPLSYDILHEDESLLAVAKPSGLPTMPAGGFYQNTLSSLVQRRFADATPLHRLGRGTSGLVVFARTSEARTALSRDFRERRIHKLYRTIASGDPSWDHLVMETPIGPVAHPLLGSIHAASPGGKAARSEAWLVERRTGSCLLDVVIETGRPHQIRIHLAAAGHPLLGDPLYLTGGHADPRAIPGDEGYRLHAWRIELLHPSTGLPLRLEAPPTPDLLPA